MVVVVAPIASPMLPRIFSYLAPTTISSVPFTIDEASVFKSTAATPPSVQPRSKVCALFITTNV